MTNEAITDGPRLWRRSLGGLLLEFLGSMNLAITLLVVIAIASVIGTVLQQNQPYQDYIIKFGPFWFDVFRGLGLYDIYGSLWFMGILGFLVLSVSVCIYRQAPGMMREMVHFRDTVQARSLRAFRNAFERRLEGQRAKSVLQAVTAVLRARGYRWRIRERGDHLIVAGMKGGFNRLGYVFTHLSIVVICVGGLLDGNFMLKLREWGGDLRVETRDLTASQVPEDSRLSPDQNPSFRGNVMLPEGSAANFVFLRLRDGFLIQELPFAIELKDFRVAYYSTGQPKSFESDLVIYDKEHLDRPLEATIEVNHPLIYRGYAIYQSDFGDGGSILNIRAWPLMGQRDGPMDVKGVVGRKLPLTMSDDPLTLEIDDFRLFNILPVPEAGAKESGDEFRNFGPNFTFKLRNSAGEAQEFVNYMAPVELDGRWYFLSGVRSSVAEPFSYLHIPADNRRRLDRFFAFAALIQDSNRVAAVLKDAFSDVWPLSGVELSAELGNVREHLIAMFVRGGFEAVVKRAQQVVPPERLDEATALYLDILRGSLAELYLAVLREEGVEDGAEISEEDEAFFNDSLMALSVLPAYGSPYFLQLATFDQVEASGLQVTRASAQYIVYAGFGLLIVGVFIMFYTSHRRVWAWISTDLPDQTQVIFAGTGNRQREEFEREFDKLRAALERRLTHYGATAP